MNRLIILLFAVMVMAFAVPASATLVGWEAAATADSPGFIATNVPLGVYDIGAYGGEQTYEFVVNCNPDEDAVSMALVGRHGHGDTTAAIKYEQWNNLETYGATIFGVVDLDYGVAINRGVDTHLVFVASEAAGTTELYVDGALAGSVDGVISLSGVVGIGGANRDPEGSGWVDPFDGDIFGAAIYDGALSADQIAAHSDAYFADIISGLVRSGGASGDRDMIGPYEPNTAPLPTEEGGLKDGNYVFSDRTYPLTGIPAKLEGSQYIRTFNSDKGKDVNYEITLSQAATMWVTVDDRHDSLQGNIDSLTATIGPAGTFVDTLLDVYVREKDDGSRDRPLSVFAAELPAGTYNFGTTPGNNFYILGATMESIIPPFYPGDIAISTIAGWYSQGAADREMQEVVDNVTGASIEVYTADDQICLLGWVVAHTGDGVADLLILNGVLPDILYPGGNAQPDGSWAEEFLDDGNIIINTGDYMFYVNNAGANNGEGGLRNMMDIPGIAMWDDTDCVMTAEGHAVAPTLQDLRTNRPFHIDQLEGDWEPELILAPNAAGTKADPIIVVNTVTGGRLGIFYQTASKDNEPRGEVISEWINNWYLTAGGIPNSTDWKTAPADGAISVGIDDDLSWTAGLGSVSHDVYFGSELPIGLAGIADGTSFDVGILDYGTTYYYQVDAVDKKGNALPGDLQSFTTTTPVGIFEYTQDIGGPAGLGRTTYEGYVWKNDTLAEQYRVMGSGGDIQSTNDQFHFAWNRVSGDILISASFEWVVASNDWAKMGVMLRAGAAGNDINHCIVTRKNEDLVSAQRRVSKGDGTGYENTNGTPVRLGIQRITAEGLTWVQSLADFGNGWESMGVVLVQNLPDELLVGICITSHDNSHLAQARVTDVTYELNPSLVGDLGLATVPADADLGAPTSDVSGFSIRSLKPLVSDGWGYDAMNELLDTGTWMGLPAQPGTEGTRIDEFVNVRDTGNGVFSEANGYPDKSYPGIDPLEDPAQDPAAGDDDDNFATEILGCIQLTAGLHKIGASSDDGTIIEIGGVEIGRTGEWKGTSNEDFLYMVEADGYYNLRARTMEGGGGASIELHEIFLDGTRILLNDVANGGSAVFAPAP